MSAPNIQSVFSSWWDWRCQRYLEENFGKVAEEIRPQITGLLFPPSAEPTLPEQTLPLAFIHLRLLAGEDLTVILKRLEELGALYGVRGVRPKIGTIYLILTALTSTPGRLSSLVQAQSAFFSLLLRRIAELLDQGSNEDEVREEMAGVWAILSDEAENATLTSARGLWRRSREPHLGISDIPFDLKEWMGQNDLGDEMESAKEIFSNTGSHPHLEVLAERLAAVDVLRRSDSAPDEEERVVREHTLQIVQESLAEGMEGLVPWETEALRPTVPLLSSIEDWSIRLKLLGEGETPTARPGRDRLPDWLINTLNEESPEDNGGTVLARRLSVGGNTYLIAGIDAGAFSAELAMVSLLSPVREGDSNISLRIRFGDGAEKSFVFDLGDGKDLLLAILLALQDDIRLDLFVRTEDGQWRFAASRYLLPNQENRDLWLRMIMEFLHREFSGEADRIKLAILKGINV